MHHQDVCLLCLTACTVTVPVPVPETYGFIPAYPIPIRNTEEQHHARQTVDTAYRRECISEVTCSSRLSRTRTRRQTRTRRKNRERGRGRGTVAMTGIRNRSRNKEPGRRKKEKGRRKKERKKEKGDRRQEQEAQIGIICTDPDGCWTAGRWNWKDARWAGRWDALGWLSLCGWGRSSRLRVRMWNLLGRTWLEWAGTGRSLAKRSLASILFMSVGDPCSSQ